MVDPRVGVLAFYGDAWQAVVWVVGFAVLARQAYGAWEDQRAWAAPGWIAGPVVLATVGLASSLLLLLSVPHTHASPWILGQVMSAVVAPVGMPLQLSAALLLATAPVALYRLSPHAPGEARHVATVCVLLAWLLGSFAADLEVHRALWVHHALGDPARVDELRALARLTGPGLATALAVCGTATLAWCLPTLRASGRLVLPWVLVPVVVGAAVYGVSGLQAAALLQR